MKIVPGENAGCNPLRLIGLEQEFVTFFHVNEGIDGRFEILKHSI